MAMTTPAAWRSLRQENVDLGEMLGAPDIGRRAALAGARGAFASRARDVSSPGSLFLLADRPVAGVPRQQASVQDSVGAFARIAPSAVPDADDVRHVRTLQSGTGAHVVVQQRIRGHDVVGGRFS
ncbi:MAG: hypothetical protein LC799_27425, partial [Actinobacteria bacterium]|nr:hypothetical protein [Actinomycetota bacterium]